MHGKKAIFLATALLAAVLPWTPAQGQDRERSPVEIRGLQIQVKGTLGFINEVPVITVWGTPWERGFAYGYLMQDRIVGLFNRFLSSGKIMDAPSFEKARIKLSLFRIHPRFEAELRGMLEGIEARAGGPVEMPSLGRLLRYEDLVLANCMGDAGRIRMSCSSFAAWGAMTEDGGTIAGRNYEWPLCPSLVGTQVVTVHLPQPDISSPGFVSVNYPGCIGCITAMNGEGVTVSTHDSTCNPPTTPWGFTPITLLYREVLESTRAETATEDITALLREQFTITGNNLIVSRPCAGRGPGAFVFEHGPNLKDGSGVTLRMSGKEGDFIACTNRFFKRAAWPGITLHPCARYSKLQKELKRLAGRSRGPALSLDGAWKLAESVPIEGIVTYHRLIFEPDKLRMHVSFPADGSPVKKITLNVSELLRKGAKAARGKGR